uniref:hypothetical protein n=1 Tax=Cutleria multifida TaxID=74475 RepID=UPI002E77ABF5|nr:hypothetical protein V2479_pgp081 [Cutleria multifida]WAM62615.1 hypothetical protein [Cutleria multifida]
MINLNHVSWIPDHFIKVNENQNIPNYSDINDESSSEENINKIYKRYQKNRINNIQKKLNKIKVYFIVKSMVIDGEKVMVTIPINNFDDLSNSPYSKALSIRVGTFQMRTDKDLKNMGQEDSIKGNRPFILEHTLESEGPYGGIPQIPIESLMIPEEENIDHLSEREKELFARSKWRIGTEFITDSNGKQKILYQYYITEHEYDYVFLDNTIFTNVEQYLTDPRDRENFKKTFKDKLYNLDFIHLWDKNKKTLRGLDVDKLVYTNTDELLSKNIIPIFSDLEEAQDLLIAVFEEILQPFRRYPEFSYADEPLIVKNLDYLDQSFSFEIRGRVPETRLEKIQDWLVRHRIIKANENYKDSFYTSPYKVYFKEESDVYFDMDTVSKNDDYGMTNYPRDFVCFDNYISKFDQVLLKNLYKTKIVSMGLGDFLNFWNNNEIKNGEVLFIPSSKDIKKRQLSLSNEKSIDPFYEYQQNFRYKTDNIDEYIYEIES